MRNIATRDGRTAILLFIAELNGFKNGTVEDKETFGKNCYKQRKLHNLTLSSDDVTNEQIIARYDFDMIAKQGFNKLAELYAEEDRKELHENIWLERLYDQLDEYASNKEIRLLQEALGEPLTPKFKWSVPIEADASASMLGYEGALLGDERLLRMTNMHGDMLCDPWHLEGLSRLQVKKAATPLLYGSLQSVKSLWDNAKLKYKLEDLITFSKELESGALGLANDFKTFIISNCNPKAEMKVKVFRDEFTIVCNRWKHVGDVTVSYDIYDSNHKRIRRIHHTKTKNVADLEQFRSYFVTLLIHCLDSQVMDRVVKKVYEKYQWVLDIHDAVIVCPEAAADVRRWYAEEMDLIYQNRKTILNNYFKSIGITGTAMAEWEQLQSKVHPVTDFKCQPMVLK